MGIVGKTWFVPTVAEIAADCAEIKATWSPAEQEARLAAAVDWQVWLLAEIMRPMAQASGLLRETVAQDCAGGAISGAYDPNIVPAIDAARGTLEVSV